MERTLAAIMAGDVVGYSRLMADDEAGTYDRLRAGVGEVVLPSVAAHGGRVFKTTGDGFLAVFGSAGEAVDAAVAIQDGFAGRALPLRIGLNLGDVIQDAGDVFGDGVNTAARIEAMAEPGGVCASAAVVRAVGRRPDLHFVRLGQRRGKNLPEPIEVHALRRGPPRRAAPTWRIAVAAGLALALVAGGALWWQRAPLIAELHERLPGAPGALAANPDSRPAVAVLPFDNLGGDPAQDYFSDGLSEDIITELARNRELMVIARNSTFAFKDRPTDIREVGAALGARYVVEGSARRAGDQLRVVAQLIDAESGVHLWSQRYDRTVADVFAVQTDVTRQIVASLVSYVRDTEAAATAGRPTGSLMAYELVLRGRARYQRDKDDPAARQEARELFARAVALDPGYAAAHANLGLLDIAGHMRGDGGGDLVAGIARAREAIRLAPDLPVAYQVLSFGLAESGDYRAGLQAAERAVELNPSDPDSLMTLAKAQLRFGSYADAVANAALARRLHPMAPDHYPYIHGQALYAVGQAAAAREVMAGCLLDAPREPDCLRVEAVALVGLDRIAEARATMARLLDADPAFSLAAERRLRRFGEAPQMERYLRDLDRAGAPRGLDQVAMPRARAA